jgi:Carboxypeptidase regulatory-like domain/TonB dependent receptor/TonB-dependent Receptor Plug Domain
MAITMPASATLFTRVTHLALCLLALLPATLAAQSPTGTLTGRVSDTQGRALVGATVLAESPALQGTQRTTTSQNGDYIFKFLPPGAYTVRFQHPGFAAATLERSVGAGEPVTLHVTLASATVEENVTVTAGATSFLNSVESATSIKQTLLATLPTARSMLSAVNLSPAVHQTGPSNSYSISGAMSFENLFMVNGVAVQDNVRGDPFTLFIEDAIQETTVTSSGVSAEYGRFSGGIVNTLTKSGSNVLSGSFRTSFANDNWRTVSPFKETKVDKTTPTHEATFGGALVQDRLWFFGATRVLKSDVGRETGYTKIPYVRSEDEKRVELKATQALANGQRLQVNYMGIERTVRNSAYPSVASVMDLASLTSPETPQSLVGLHYTGTFGSRLFLEGQYSRRTFTFKKAGGLSRDLVTGTPLQDQQTGAWWGAPNFCGVCADEERNNEELLVKGSYFLSTGAGSHQVAFGYNSYNDQRLVDNHQSGSDYHVWATGSLFEDGVVYPVIEPGFSTYIIHWPLQAKSKGTNFRTHSVFVNDSWALNTRLSFNLGLRYDRNAGRDASGSLVAKDGAFSPRLGVVWDPTGGGRTSVNASMGRYVSALNNTVASGGSGAGTPSVIAYFYDGAPINVGPGPRVTTEGALGRVFSWYNANRPDPFFIDIPGVATRIQGSLTSPHADEVAVGVSQRLGARTSVRVDVVDRTFADFYSRRVDTNTGQVFDEFGQAYDLKLIENTNDLSRHYRGMNLQANYNGSNLAFGGNYTLSRLSGNVDGEDVATGPLSNSLAMYPEYRQQAWTLPDGDLAADQRHRARLWTTYLLPWGRDVANVSFGVIQSVQSGTPYGAVGAVEVSRFVSNPGYATPPNTNTYYFTARDAFRTETSYRTDLAVNLDRRIGGTRGPHVFAQFQVANVLNQFQLFRNTAGEINTTALSRVDTNTLTRFNPFTTTPVEGVNWRKGDKFGQAVSRNAYTLPRTFSFSVGVTF